MKIPCCSRHSLQHWSSKYLASWLRRHLSLPQLQPPSIIPCKCCLPVPSSPLHPHCPPPLSCPSPHILLVQIHFQRHHCQRNTIHPEFVNNRVIILCQIQLCLCFQLLNFSSTLRCDLPIQSMLFCLCICLSWLMLNPIQPIRILRNFVNYLFVHCWSLLYELRSHQNQYVIVQEIQHELYLCIPITIKA